jgi:hypothetical protein
MKFITLILILTIQQSFGQTSDFNIKEAKMFIQMSNAEWRLANKEEGTLTQYIFKRKSIKDSAGREIVPAIMVFVENASKYNQDVTSYSIAKRLQFEGKGITVNKILIPENKGYPFSYKNSLLTMCSYTSNGLNHILYMVHIINKDNEGIQIYMDMTKSLVDKYSVEFWTTMKSIKVME